MKMEKVVSWSYDVLAGCILYGCDIQDGRISDVVTTYLACHMQLTSYDLFSASRVVSQQGRICEIRDTFYRDALLCIEYGKKTAKIGYFQITKQWFNVRSGKRTDELN
jgi:hypothetical protein